MADHAAKRWFIAGRVQGVGFRQFVSARARALRLSGWARNLSDGRVEVLAMGPPEALNDLASALHKGPPFSTVRSVEQAEAAPETCSGFEIR